MTFKPQSEVRHYQTHGPSSTNLMLQVGMLCVMSAGLMSGCVSSGKYEAEKARALNFQRLLAQEEQRTGELDTRLQEARQEIVSLGSQNRELTAERDTLRDQIERQQTRAAASDVPDASGDMDISPDMPFSDPSLSEYEMSDFKFIESEFNDLGMEKADSSGMGMGDTGASGLGTPTYHTVVKGDTLFNLHEKYGVSIKQLRQWNNLTDDIIQIGRRLIVSQP